MEKEIANLLGLQVEYSLKIKTLKLHGNTLSRQALDAVMHEANIPPFTEEEYLALTRKSSEELPRALRLREKLVFQTLNRKNLEVARQLWLDSL